ncbi:MAG: transcriptional regulator GcvA [Gammaproteobacteria bacterium]
MSRQLPSLNALRAFEAAGRHLSLTRAAEELHVTPAAISHQVKSLEEYLNAPLFKRVNRGLLLTDTGQMLLPGLSDAFDRVAEVVSLARKTDDQRTLTVSVSQSFASKWLIPRLDRFYAQYPRYEIRLDASPRLVDFEREGIDLGVRYGTGGWGGGLEEIRLFREEVFPVCSPKLQAGEHPIHHPEDLKWHTLLHMEAIFAGEGWIDWENWLKAAGVTDIDPRRGPRFSLLSMAIEAAIEGQGVALGRSVLVADDLAAGRLVKPLADSVPIDFAYYLVYPRRVANNPKIAAFRNWLLGEIRREEALLDTAESPID